MKRIHLLFGSLLLVIFAVVACASSQSQESDRPIKVITFNVRNSSAWSTQFDGIHCWENRKNGSYQVIKAQVPLAEMFGYATDLRSKTQGRGVYVMQMDHFEKLPDSLVDKINK